MAAVRYLVLYGSLAKSHETLNSLTWALDGVLSRRLLLRVKHIEANTGHVYLWQPTDTETQPRAGSLSLMSSVQVWEEVEMKLL